VDALIRQAIRERRLIEFWLHGLHRVAEPHLYGIHNGAAQMLVYQVGGASRSGGLPYWRRIDLAEVSGLRVLHERFEATRLEAGRPSGWDEILAVVQ
jgi:hypothetical protein